MRSLTSIGHLYWYTLVSVHHMPPAARLPGRDYQQARSYYRSDIGTRSRPIRDDATRATIEAQLQI